ncbi:hypothetical protein IQ235_12380 [Oscillatoriales cyanobacterium LEGE 11467]|uniref:Uncharacterized protein n=1 Tax=Zarconia navalis LEGE 11467 TaxID=1828826 RepID=A0A928VWL1_9CYAN|nr:calcium-binding protein [Zarconia navalis]MBE9041577.1 hypothetical protein [Zarconia navalis LEGE 11467]
MVDLAVWNFEDNNLTADGGNPNNANALASAGAGLTANIQQNNNLWRAEGWNAEATDYLQFEVDLSGHEDIQVALNAQRGAQGPATQDFQYSLNGTDFTLVEDIGIPAQPGFADYTIDLSNIDAIDDRDRVFFRIVGSTANKAFQIDTIAFTGTEIVVENDMTPPTATIAIADGGLATITFDEDVTGVDISDFGFTQNGTGVDISGLTVTEVNATTYTIDLSTVTTADGAYALTLNAATSLIQDTAATPNDLAADATGNLTVAGPDITAPTATIAIAEGGVATIVFDEDVTGVDINDFAFTQDGNVININALAVTAVDATTYNIDLSTVTAADGAYVLTLTANNSGIADTAATPNDLAVNATGNLTVGGDGGTDGGTDGSTELQFPDFPEAPTTENAVPGDDSSNILSGGETSDAIDGGAGDDAIEGGGGDDAIDGGIGDDDIDGGAGNDVIDASNGADLVFAGEGDDAVNGGDGKDIISAGTGNDIIEGGQGDDIIFGNAGTDFIQGGLGADVVFGGQGSDVIDGGEGDDALVGNLGDDSITGGAGNDVIFGNVGTDLLDGGVGDDYLLGGKGNDTLIGGDGNDVLAGNLSDDLLTGGAGGDRFDFLSNDGNDIITDFQDGIDIIGLEAGFTFADLTITQIDADTQIQAGGASITLQGVDSSLISEADIAFIL